MSITDLGSVSTFGWFTGTIPSGGSYLEPISNFGWDYTAQTDVIISILRMDAVINGTISVGVLVGSGLECSTTINTNMDFTMPINREPEFSVDINTETEITTVIV